MEEGQTGRNGPSPLTFRPGPAGDAECDTDSSLTSTESEASGPEDADTFCSSSSATEQNLPSSKSELPGDVVLWFLTTISGIAGVTTALLIGYAVMVYIETLHENRLWFTHIKEVEREISFRTESGLYYSYYKQMVEAPSIEQGLYELTHDNVTENWRTINVLQRFNIYPEVFLAAVYQSFPFLHSDLSPIFFYIRSVFFLQGYYMVALFCMGWLLSDSWLSGVLTTAFYIFNRIHTTRVDYSGPLRESFGLPFLCAQMALTTNYLMPKVKSRNWRLLGIFILSFLFAVSWQFAQFIFLLQGVALYGSSLLDLVSFKKVRCLFMVQLSAMALVYYVMYYNSLLQNTLAACFMLAALADLSQRESYHFSGGIFKKFVAACARALFVLILTFVINLTIKYLQGGEDDQHIFKFLSAKLGLANSRDFEAMLYSCNAAFGNLPFEVIRDLSKNLVFPFYAVTVIGLISGMLVAVYQKWSIQPDQNFSDKDPNPETASEDDSLEETCLSTHPEIVYHTIQTILFGTLTYVAQRMKYVWAPQMCALAAYGISSKALWELVLSKCGSQSSRVVEVVRNLASLIVLALLLMKNLPAVSEELDVLREFYDPDTVELMKWINHDTPRTAAFSGSMQLLAGVKLCTGRRLTNHPHFEDTELRKRTLQLYQMYAKRSPEDVYNIHKALGTDFMILEDSICYSGQTPGCRLKDIMDITNGHLYDQAVSSAEPDLRPSTHGRFCDIIKKSTPEFTKYFRLLFFNKTFRVYMLL